VEALPEAPLQFVLIDLGWDSPGGYSNPASILKKTQPAPDHPPVISPGGRVDASGEEDLGLIALHLQGEWLYMNRRNSLNFAL
jgi:hypothetical protein